MSLTIAGLLFDIAGAWLLAYELVWGYQKRQWAKFAEVRLGHLRKDLKRLKDRVGEIPSPPYTVAELDEMREELDEIWTPMIKKNEDIVTATTEEHQDKSIIAALLGVLFLSIGFLLQIVGAIKV